MTKTKTNFCCQLQHIKKLSALSFAPHHLFACTFSIAISPLYTKSRVEEL